MLDDPHTAHPIPSSTLLDLHLEQRWVRETPSTRLQPSQYRRLAIFDLPQSWQLEVNRSIFSNRRRREYIFLPLVLAERPGNTHSDVLVSLCFLRLRSMQARVAGRRRNRPSSSLGSENNPPRIQIIPGQPVCFVLSLSPSLFLLFFVAVSCYF